jgi:transposase
MFERQAPQISWFVLRLGRYYPRRKRGTRAHELADAVEQCKQRIVFEEFLEAVRQESERVQRLERAIREAVPEWSLAEVVTALQAMRGVDLLRRYRCWPKAVICLAFKVDFVGMRTPRELMGYLGLVLSECSTGEIVKRGDITKAGNGRTRRVLVEAAWSYRHPPPVSRTKHSVSRVVRERG